MDLLSDRLYLILEFCWVGLLSVVANFLCFFKGSCKKRILSLVESIDMFLSVSGSTASERGITKAVKSIDNIDSYDIVNELLTENGTSMFDVMNKYEALFQSHKHTVTHELNAAKGERDRVHPTVKDVLQLALTMVKTAHNDLHEFHLVYVDQETSNIRSMPDFDVQYAASPAHDAINMTFESSLLPVVVKDPTEAYIERGIVQALHYLLERIQSQLELTGDISKKLCGYCFFTNGIEVSVGRAQVSNGDLSICADMTAASDLWYSNGAPPQTLADAPGFCLLLALLDQPASTLGYFQVNNLQGIPGCTSVRVLGVGSFCACFEGELPDKRRVAIKVPRATRDTSFDTMRLLAEAKVLKVLSVLPIAPLHVPAVDYSLSRFYGLQCCLVMGDVGISLIDAIICFRWTAKDRSKHGKVIFDLLLRVLIEIRSKLRMCHCDIAPSNMVIKGTSTDWTPMLIDWDLARSIGKPYHEFSGRVHLMHRELVEYFNKLSKPGKEKPSPPLTRAEFDIFALQYSMTCFIYGRTNLNAPWSRIPLKDSYFIWRNKMTQNRHKSPFFSRDDIKAGLSEDDISAYGH